MARGKTSTKPASKPAPKPPAPKIANPANGKGKSRANEPKKPQPAAVSKGMMTKNTSRKPNTNKDTTKAGPSSSTKRLQPEDLFEDEDEIIVPPPSKKKKAIVPPTPERETEASARLSSSPLSYPPSEVSTKHIRRATSSPPPAKASSSARRATPDPELADGEYEDEDEEEDEDVKPVLGENNSQHAQDDIDEQEQDEEDEEEEPGQADEDEDVWDRFQNPKAAADALTAALDNESNIKKSDRVRYLRPFQKAARLVPRLITPFMSIGPTIETAMRLDPSRPYEQQTDQEALEDLNESTYRDTINFYRSLIEHCPQLPKAMHAFADNAGAFGELCKYMDQRAAAARREDVSRIRATVLTYIPDLPMTLKLRKSERGWNNEYTARLLCPQTMLQRFEVDWKSFTQKVKQGDIELCEYHLPSFLWDQTIADPDDITVGLFRGPLLVSCFRNIFTGPRTGDTSETGLQPGKACFVQMYNIRSVLPIMIGYIAILIRFALNSQRAWKEQDGDFKAGECLQYILGLFGSDEEGGKAWATQTIEWWNLQVLSVKPHEFRVPIEESAVAMIHAVFARKSKKD